MKITWWGAYIRMVKKHGRPDKAAELCGLPAEQVHAVFRAYPELLEEVREAVRDHRDNIIRYLIAKGEGEGGGVRATCYSHRIDLQEVLKWAEEYPDLLKRLQACVEADTAEKEKKAEARKAAAKKSGSMANRLPKTVWVLVMDWQASNRTLMGIFAGKDEGKKGLADHIDSYDKQWVFPVLSDDGMMAQVYDHAFHIVELPINTLMSFDGWDTRVTPMYQKENG